MRITTWMVAGAALFALSGCAGEQEPPMPEVEGEVPVDDEVADPDGAGDPDGVPAEGAPGDGGATDDPAASSDPVLGAETMAAIDAVVGDGADRDDVLVVDAAFVTWSDSSLGCPEPGMMYTQALVEGFRILLDVDGEEVAFHGDDRGRMIRCDDPQPPVDGSAEG